MRKLKVLVVHDSLIFREVLARGISSDPHIELSPKPLIPLMPNMAQTLMALLR